MASIGSMPIIWRGIRRPAECSRNAGSSWKGAFASGCGRWAGPRMRSCGRDWQAIPSPLGGRPPPVAPDRSSGKDRPRPFLPIIWIWWRADRGARPRACPSPWPERPGARGRHCLQDATRKRGESDSIRPQEASGPDPPEAVRAPAVASNAMVDDEQALGVIAPLDRLQPRPVTAPARSRTRPCESGPWPRAQ